MSYRVLTDYAEQVKHIQPIMQSLGSDIPVEGNGVIFTEFDEQGEVMAFQILQTITVAEGLWARDGRAHLRTLCNMMLNHLKVLGGEGRTLFTITRNDEAGKRIAKAARYMGFETLDWALHRRKV